MITTPVQDRILIKPLQLAVSMGGIIFADIAVPQTVEAEVIAVGPGKENKAGVLIPVDVAVGDKIIFERGQGHEIEQDGVTLLVIKEENVLGKWEQ